MSSEKYQQCFLSLKIIAVQEYFLYFPKKLKNLEFGISMVSSLLFYFPPFLVTRFREVLNEEDNLAFKIKFYLCIK